MAAEEEKAIMWHGRENSGGSWPPAFPPLLTILIQHHEDDLFIDLKEISGIAATTKSKQYLVQ